MSNQQPPQTNAPTPQPGANLGWWKASDGQWYPPQSTQPWQPPPAPPTRKKRHLGRWVLLGVIALIVIVVVAGGGKKKTSVSSGSSATTASGIASNSNNGSHPPQADINPGWTCSADALGQYQAAGTVTNHSSKTSSYLISVSFIDASGVRVDDGTAIVNEVLAGQTATWKAVSFTDSKAGSKCQITKVDRNGF